MRVYLAQSMLGYGGQSEFSTKLREALVADGHVAEDPYEFENTGWTDAQLVAFDLKMVDNSDVVIVYLQRPSNGGGTYAELYHASWTGKPVILVSPKSMYGPWMRHHTTAFVNTDEITSVDDLVVAAIDLAKLHYRPAPEPKPKNTVVEITSYRL
jgi:nucleoside 2-deoxyribosyltransferase